VLREALGTDGVLDAEMKRLADGDADPGATEVDFRRAVDVLLERDLAQQMKALLAEAAARPEALQMYRELDRQWRTVKQRQAAPAGDE
jgi:hypothetical protein